MPGETNWIWRTPPGSRVSARQCRPPSTVPTSSGEHPVLWQLITAQACAGSVAVSDSGYPVPRHCTCQVAPDVLVCQMTAVVLVEPGLVPGWPVSHPSAAVGKATPAYVGVSVPALLSTAGRTVAASAPAASAGLTAAAA
jgi:hypothetical protein